jgi:16S rRNA U516 pseudouridylate synthase RsuA-like enzyme
MVHGLLPTRLDTWLKNSIGCSKDHVNELMGCQRVRIVVEGSSTEVKPAGLEGLVFPGDKVLVDGEEQSPWEPQNAKVFVLHMPKNLRMVHGKRKGGRMQVPKDHAMGLNRRHCFVSWKEEIETENNIRRLFAVGRLDRKTSGLLLVTNDGDLSYLLCSEGRCAKEYIVVVNRLVTEKKLQALCSGVQLSEGFAK